MELVGKWVRIILVLVPVAFFVESIIVYGNGDHEDAIFMLLVEAVLLLAFLIILVIAATSQLYSSSPMKKEINKDE